MRKAANPIGTNATGRRLQTLTFFGNWEPYTDEAVAEAGVQIPPAGMVVTASASPS